MAQVHLGLRLFPMTTRTPILSPAFQLAETEKSAHHSTTSEMIPAITIHDQVKWALLGPLMVVVRALTQITGIWTPGVDITLREGEEGVAVGIDNLTGVEEVVVKELHSIHNEDASLSRNGVVPTIPHPVWHLRAVSPTHTATNRVMEVVLGNGVATRR